MYVCMYVCMYLFIYIYIYIYIHIRTYIHIYIFIGYKARDKTFSIRSALTRAPSRVRVECASY